MFDLKEIAPATYLMKKMGGMLVPGLIIATEENTRVQFDDPHTDILTGETGLDFTIPQDDARILLKQ